MNLELSEEERQMLLLALAHLSVQRPGWDRALHEVARRIDNVQDERAVLYDQFRKLHERRVLLALSEWCRQQPGNVLWTLFQTCDEGKRGFQMLVMNHETHDHVWHCNARDLSGVTDQTAVWLRGQR